MGSTFSNYLPEDGDAWKWSRVTLYTAGLAVALHVTFNVARTFYRLRQECNRLKAFPGPPQQLLFGNLTEFSSADGPSGAMNRWVKTYGSPFWVRFGPFLNYVTVADPESVRAIVTSSEPKDRFTYRFFEPFIGGGLFLAEGRLWERNRKLLSPAFHLDILKGYVDVFSDSTNIMIERWREALTQGPRLEMFEYIGLMSLHSILKCAFGFEGNVQMEGKNDKYVAAIYNIGLLIGARFGNPFIHNDSMYSFSYTAYKMRKVVRGIRNFSKEVIEAKRQKKAASSEERQGKHLQFIDILFEARDSEGQGLTDREIQGEVDTFMFAGHDTTTSGLSWFLYNLARNPEHQTKCRAEVQKVLGERNTVTWEDLPKLEYLTLCLKESLRLHPAVPSFARRVTKPIKMPNGLTVPAGTGIIVYVDALHHNEAVWEDPFAFKPERFTQENSKDRSPYAYLPFSAGPRNCIGQHFALHELKTSSALLLKHFEFSVAEEPKPVPAITMRTLNGMWLNVKEI